jgi:hypothetical protein
MKTLAHLASALLAAATFVLPVSAMAETKAPAGHHHAAKHESVWPMKADTFRKMVDGNIEKMKGHFEKGAKKRSLSHDQKQEIDKSLESALKDLHAAVDKVSSDGVVTKDESQHIKDLTAQLRTKVRDELKGKHANAKAKGQKSGKKAGKKAPAKKHEPKADKS